MILIGHDAGGVVTHVWEGADEDLLMAQVGVNGCAGSLVVDAVPALGDLVVGGAVVSAAPDPAAELAAARARMIISPRQLFIAMAIAGFCSPEEAVAAATVGAMPAALDGLLASLSPADAMAARITWARMTEVRRVDPLADLIASAAGVDPAAADAFFALAATV